MRDFLVSVSSIPLRLIEQPFINPSPAMSSTAKRLVALSHEIGREDRRLVMLGEGNTSVDLGDGTFLVKSSGCGLAAIREEEFTQVHMPAILGALDDKKLNDSGVRAVLESARVDPQAKLPSIETFMHAVCLSAEGVKWVAHCHTESVMSILCSVHGSSPFLKHIFPDAINVCGRHVATVPYIDPGLELARKVRETLRFYNASFGHAPKVILLENHGLVALGATDSEVLDIIFMLDKWARILGAALAAGGPRYLPDTVSDRINSRPDHQYRRNDTTKQSNQKPNP